jgi:hypothetical protein
VAVPDSTSVHQVKDESLAPRMTELGHHRMFTFWANCVSLVS